MRRAHARHHPALAVPLWGAVSVPGLRAGPPLLCPVTQGCLIPPCHLSPDRACLLININNNPLQLLFTGLKAQPGVTPVPMGKSPLRTGWGN